MKIRFILFSVFILAMAAGCGENKSENDYLAQYKKTVDDDKDYEICKEHINLVIKHVEMYKKYKGKPPENLSVLKDEYNIDPVCPSSKKPYVYTSIVPKPGEEVTGESIRAFYDGPDKRTFKIYCPHHRIKEYGR